MRGQWSNDYGKQQMSAPSPPPIKTSAVHDMSTPATPVPQLPPGVQGAALPAGHAGASGPNAALGAAAGGPGGGVAAVAIGAPMKRRRWYLGIQSKKDPAHVMTEVGS